MSHDLAPPRSRKQRAWLAENLVQGVAPERLVARLEQLGLAPAEAREEVEAARRHPLVQQGARNTRQLGELLSLLQSYTALHRQSGWHQRLERRQNLPPHEFLERYYFPNRPVVLQGMMNHWPALECWRPERLTERFGDVEVEIMSGRETDPGHDISPDRFRTRIRLGDFLHKLLTQGPSNDYYLTARNFALERSELRGMLDDVRPIPGYLRAPGPKDIRLWVGPAGTVTELHHDLNGHLFCQVSGRKRFKLIPIFEIASVYNQQRFWSAVDALRPDLERYPAYCEADILDVVLEPGEILFLPVGWWHWVHALDVSVSATFSCFDLPGKLPSWRIHASEQADPTTLTSA
ncbi:cupin-like domain-containing protein [Hyalangium sp.]|uniref:cupin-like domain-containing protein n=1 Tax=Hyalangium sp. TaxID=2028555 RepID=UPI002D69F932|nr:cupin-like domain-containing protein [Hyalangium sp.]HYH99655.1 cupin-like domain-containing protein [Hyalangium sp.]